MPKLVYKTRGMSAPKGKPRVYFCCHPADFPLYFESVSAELLRLQNCAVWYDEEPDAPYEEEELREDLSQMQLLVVPVTSRFLYQKNRAREVEFTLAVRLHIPVLPLMQEGGLETDFNRICGDLQFLDKRAADATAISYEDKLSRFLSDVLVGDELAEKVRAAFDAYVFLSYRKKDRKYAQELMRLIHKNEFCRDLAIWYDEFLTPGENFNDSIRDALEKSDLFAMVVTPSLVEEDNYVMTTEYPMAQKAGKPVLPAEMVRTDRAALSACYSSLSACTDAHREGELSEALLRNLKQIATTENDSDPSHLLFIGLAYLNGIDVEVDAERALALIREAADKELPEAVSWLVGIYRTGHGVKRDYEEAVRYQAKLADLRRKAWEARRAEEEGDAYWSALLDLGIYYEELKRFASAQETYENVLSLVQTLQETTGNPIYEIRLDQVCERLGDIRRLQSDVKGARAYYERALSVSEKRAKTDKSPRALRNLSADYERMGDINLAEGNLAQARHYFEEGLRLREELNRFSDSEQTRRDLCVGYNRMGDIFRSEGNRLKAKEYYEKGLALAESMVGEAELPDALTDLSISHEKLGENARFLNDLAGAAYHYKKCCELREKAAEKLESAESRRNLAIAYEHMGDVSRSNGNAKEAADWYGKGLKIAEAMWDETAAAQSRRDLAVILERMGDAVMMERNFVAARVYYERSFRLKKEGLEEEKTVQSRRDYGVCCHKMGDVCFALGDYQTAFDRFKEALLLFEEIAAEQKTPLAYEDLAVSYAKLSDVSGWEGKFSCLQKACDLYAMLSRRHPEVGRYQARLAQLRPVLEAVRRKLGKKV